jgi:hypothetical protein
LMNVKDLDYGAVLQDMVDKVLNSDIASSIGEMVGSVVGTVIAEVAKVTGLVSGRIEKSNKLISGFQKGFKDAGGEEAFANIFKDVFTGMFNALKALFNVLPWQAKLLGALALVAPAIIQGGAMLLAESFGKLMMGMFKQGASLISSARLPGEAAKKLGDAVKAGAKVTSSGVGITTSGGTSKAGQVPGKGAKVTQGRGGMPFGVDWKGLGKAMLGIGGEVESVFGTKLLEFLKKFQNFFAETGPSLTKATAALKGIGPKIAVSFAGFTTLLKEIGDFITGDYLYRKEPILFDKFFFDLESSLTGKVRNLGTTLKNLLTKVDDFYIGIIEGGINIVDDIPGVDKIRNLGTTLKNLLTKIDDVVIRILEGNINVLDDIVSGAKDLASKGAQAVKGAGAGAKGLATGGAKGIGGLLSKGAGMAKGLPVRIVGMAKGAAGGAKGMGAGIGGLFSKGTKMLGKGGGILTAGVGIIEAVSSLLKGESLGTALGKGAGPVLGTIIGTALLGPLGGFIGGWIGSMKPVTDTLSGVFEGLFWGFEKLGETLGPALDAFGGVISSIVGVIVGMIPGMDSMTGSLDLLNVAFIAVKLALYPFLTGLNGVAQALLMLKIGILQLDKWINKNFQSGDRQGRLQAEIEKTFKQLEKVQKSQEKLNKELLKPLAEKKPLKPGPKSTPGDAGKVGYQTLNGKSYWKGTDGSLTEISGKPPTAPKKETKKEVRPAKAPQFDAGKLWDDYGAEWAKNSKKFLDNVRNLPENLAWLAGYSWEKSRQASKKIEEAHINFESKVSKGWDNILAWWSSLSSDFQTTGNQTTSSLNEQWTRFTNWVRNIGPNFQTAVNQTVSYLTTQWTRFTNWWNSLPTKLQTAVNQTVSSFNTQWARFTTWWNSLPAKFQTAISKAISTLQSAWQRLTSWFSGLGPKFASLAGQTATALGNGTQQITTAILNWAKGLVSKIVPVFNAGAQAAKTPVGSRWDPAAKKTVIVYSDGSTSAAAEAFGSGNSFTGPLSRAISFEQKNKPPGSDLVIANSSETVIPAASGNEGGIAGFIAAFRDGFSSLASVIRQTAQQSGTKLTSGFSTLSNTYKLAQERQASAMSRINSTLVSNQQQTNARLAKLETKFTSPGMPGGLGGGAAGGVDAFTPIAQRMGLTMTSGYRPGDPGWHGANRARDYSNGTGPTPQMMQFAQTMASTYGSNLKELIYTPLGFSIKNGQRVAPYAQAAHYNHVHVAYATGWPAMFPSQKEAMAWEQKATLGNVSVASITARQGEFGGSGEININAPISITQQPGQDADELASIVALRIGEAVAQARSASVFV